MKKLLFISLVVFAGFSSCENGDWEFSDYNYQTVYFAYQSPIRTITLGDDIFDTSLDNQHKCKIMATTGGVYSNEKNITIGIEVDNSLCNGLLFKSNGANVIPMPSNYYSLSSNQIRISKGEWAGGVEVQLTDAFFADPLALSTNYVIPVYMTSVENADSILSGKAKNENAIRTHAGDWDVAPKDYILYAIKYINPWHGNYLRRGRDVVGGKNGNASLDTTVSRKAEYVEYDEVCKLSTQSLNDLTLTVSFKDGVNSTHYCDLLLNVDEEGEVVISSNSAGYTISGSGKFVSKGEKNSWGNKDRDAIYLSFQIDMTDMHVAVTDTLVMRDRGVKMDTFEFQN